jgi:glycosyltransferase involved in cell wall biosynthesis
MNILLINHYAGSNIHGMEYRPFYLAREWVKLGHKVNIIAASFSHLRSKEPNINGKITKEVIEGIHYIWLRTPRYKGNGLGRVINMMTFSLMLFMQKSELICDGKPDLVIASSPHPFIIFGSLCIARSLNAKMVFEVRDLWPLTLIELGSMSRFHPFVIFMHWAEKYSYRKSDYVISLLSKADTYMNEQGMARHKFFYIPNGVDVAEWRQNVTPLPEYHQNVLTSLKREGRFIVGYAGGHGISNALDSLIEAARILESRPVTFILVGNGSEKKRLEQKVSYIRLQNIIFLPSIPKSAIPSLLEFMDVLFIGWLRSPLYRFGISPNKLLDYMMSGKPVIHATDAENDMVAESGCGISIPPENPEAIVNAVVRLLNMTDSEREHIGLKGKEYVVANHDYRVLAEKYLGIF